MLNIAAIVDQSIAYSLDSEECKLAAYSGFILAVSLNTYRVPEGRAAYDFKTFRKHLAARAEAAGFIAKNTWQSYVKSIDGLAKMIDENMNDDPAYLGIFALDDAAAGIDGMRRILETLNIRTGGHIRDFVTAGKWEPLDLEAAKAAKRAEAAAKSHAKKQAAQEAFFHTPAPVQARAALDGALPEGIDAVAAILAALAKMSSSDRLAITAGLNDMLAADAKTAAAALTNAPAPTVAPVLADDVVPHPLSALGRVRAAKPAKAA